MLSVVTFKPQGGTAGLGFSDVADLLRFTIIIPFRNIATVEVRIILFHPLLIHSKQIAIFFSFNPLETSPCFSTPRTLKKGHCGG